MFHQLANWLSNHKSTRSVSPLGTSQAANCATKHKQNVTFFKLGGSDEPDRKASGPTAANLAPQCLDSRLNFESRVDRRNTQHSGPIKRRGVRHMVAGVSDPGHFVLSGPIRDVLETLEQLSHQEPKSIWPQ